MKDVLDDIGGYTTAAVMWLLNDAVAQMPADECYCEVGSYRGATFIGAMRGNCRRGIAIENFSEFGGCNALPLMNSVEKYLAGQDIVIKVADFQDILTDWSDLPIGVFFYDAAHDYRSTLMALMMATKNLADNALVVVDDYNFSHVKQAVYDFLALNPKASVKRELTTKENGEEPWWNGVVVIQWSVASSNKNRVRKLSTVCKRIYDIRDGCP